MKSVIGVVLYDIPPLELYYLYVDELVMRFDSEHRDMVDIGGTKTHDGLPQHTLNCMARGRAARVTTNQ